MKEKCSVIAEAALAPDREAPLLAAHALVKRYGGFTAVDGMSLTVARGEIAGLIGPNGAGKTTMFDMIAGGQPPDSGHIRIAGRYSPAEAPLPATAPSPAAPGANNPVCRATIASAATSSAKSAAASPGSTSPCCRSALTNRGTSWPSTT